jgi:hypothetical protein
LLLRPRELLRLSIIEGARGVIRGIGLGLIRFAIINRIVRVIRLARWRIDDHIGRELGRRGVLRSNSP